MAFTPQNLQQLSQQAGSNNQQLGTGYTNLNRIMDANKGNQLGQQVAGTLQNQVGGIQNQLGQQQDQFKTEADKNQIGSDADKADRNATINKFAPSSSDVGSGRSGATTPSPSAQTPGATPSSSGQAVTSQDTQNFQKYLSGNYAGPQGLKDTSNLQTQAGQLQQQTSNLSPSGTQELLRRTVNNSKYSQGQQGLDSMLMDRSALTPIQRQAANLSGNINRADLAATGQAQAYKNQAQQFADQTKGLLNNGMSGIDNTIQGQLKTAQDAEVARQANLANIQGITGTGITGLSQLQQAMQNANIDPTQLKQVFGTGNIQDTYNQLNTARQGALNTVYNVPEWAQGAMYHTGALANSLSAAGHAAFDPYASQINQLSGQGVIGQKLANLNNSGFNLGDISSYQPGILNNILANSQNAQGINAQGVASNDQIGNYNALNKLMGGSQTSPYQARVQSIDPNTGLPMFTTNPDGSKGQPIYNTQQYQAGTIGFDPTKL
jgi:hypothetical protein